MASTTSGSPQRPKTPVPVPSSPFVSPTRTKVSSPSNISRKNALIRPTSPDTFLEASQQLDDSPSHPKFERTGTERLAGPANRLLGGPTRLYIGNAKRPQSPNPKNLKEVPPDTPNLPNIFKIGEAERAAFKAASSPPHPAVSFSVEASGKPHRNRPQLTVTGSGRLSRLSTKLTCEMVCLQCSRAR